MPSNETKEQVKERMAKVRAARRGPTDAGLPTPPMAALTDDETPILGELGRLAVILGRSAGDAEKEQVAVDGIFNSIASLSREGQRRLFERQEVRDLFRIADEKDNPEAKGSPDDPPGTIYYRTIGGQTIPWSKKPWTWAWLWAKYPTKTWPNGERRITLGFNGLMVTIHPHQEVTLPEVFHGLWQDRVKLSRDAEQHAAYIFGRRDKPPDDPGLVTSATAMARSLSLGEAGKRAIYEPGGGFVAVDIRPEE